MNNQTFMHLIFINIILLIILPLLNIYLQNFNFYNWNLYLFYKKDTSYNIIIKQSERNFLIHNRKNQENFLIFNQNQSFIKTLIQLSLFFGFYLLTLDFLLNNELNLLIQKYSNIEQNFFFKFCSLWSNHEGSFFLWNVIIILSCTISLKNFLTSNQINKHNINIYWIIFLFLFLLIFTANPFINNFWLNKNYLNLNPILQDILLLIHPPFLYIGYVSFSFLFILSIYILYTEKLLIKFNKIIQYFSIIFWFFLTIGIFLGSWWAYHELGWGGWWFWDPVENISLIPWLFVLILNHFLVSQKNSNTFKYQNFIWGLIFILFLFNIFGTSMIRSGFLNSVHMFATDNTRGFFLFSIFFQYLILLISGIYNKISNKFFFTKKNLNIFIGILLYFMSNLIIIFGTFIPLFFQQTNLLKNMFYHKILTPILGSSIIPIFNVFNKKITFFNIMFWTGNFIFYWIFFFYILRYFNESFANIFLFIIFIILLIIFQSSSKISNKNSIFHFSIIYLFCILMLSKYLEIEFFKIINLNLNFAVYDFIFHLRNHFYIEQPTYNINYSNFVLYSNDFFNLTLNILFPEKRYYIDTNTYLVKNNIYSNLLGDIQIFPSSGNIYNGWLYKIKFIPFLIFLWLWILLFSCYKIYLIFYYYYLNKYLLSSYKFILKKR